MAASQRSWLKTSETTNYAKCLQFSKPFSLSISRLKSRLRLEWRTIVASSVWLNALFTISTSLALSSNSSLDSHSIVAQIWVKNSFNVFSMKVSPFKWKSSHFLSEAMSVDSTQGTAMAQALTDVRLRTKPTTRSLSVAKSALIYETALRSTERNLRSNWFSLNGLIGANSSPALHRFSTTDGHRWARYPFRCRVQCEILTAIGNRLN